MRSVNSAFVSCALGMPLRTDTLAIDTPESGVERSGRDAARLRLLRVLLKQPIHVTLLVGGITLPTRGIRRFRCGLGGLLEGADRPRSIPGLIHALLRIGSGRLGAAAHRVRH